MTDVVVVFDAGPCSECGDPESLSFLGEVSVYGVSVCGNVCENCGSLLVHVPLVAPGAVHLAVMDALADLGVSELRNALFDARPH